jgi:fused signal recognition particle receptor
VKRVLGRLDPGAPHEVLLVLDGGSGQNALLQARRFNEAVGITGIVITKLDGTAKGGIVLAIAREFGVPVRYIGIGEGIEDLQPFEAGPFVDALLAERKASPSA